MHNNERVVESMDFFFLIPVRSENCLGQVIERLSWKDRRRDSESVILKIIIIKEVLLLAIKRVVTEAKE